MSCFVWEFPLEQLIEHLDYLIPLDIDVAFRWFRTCIVVQYHDFQHEVAHKLYILENIEFLLFMWSIIELENLSEFAGRLVTGLWIDILSNVQYIK